MKEWNTNKIGQIKQDITKQKEIDKQNGQCMTCNHMKLSHIAACFIRGCECKKYVSIK